MKNALSSWNEIETRLRIPKNKLFLFDFDGTLAAITNHPNESKMDARVSAILKKLLKVKNVRVGIISGRSLVDIKKKVGINNIIYAGNHGLEAQGPRVRFVHPKSASMKKSLAIIAKEAKIKGTKIKGLLVENKGLTASIHYRNVEKRNWNHVEALIDHLKPLCRIHNFSWGSGKIVFEIIPNIQWNKGTFVKWLAGKLMNPLAVYTGDDVTDENVFRMMNKKGIMIRIGKEKDSAASYYLKSQRDVPAFLKKLGDICH